MKIVIIGGVAAGMTCAAKLRRSLPEKDQIYVYEKGKDVSYGACGIPFYISGEIENVDDLIAKKPEQFINDGINLNLEHEVKSIDTLNKTVNIMNLKDNTLFSQSYDKLIIASGASSIKIFDREYNNLFQIRDLQDATSIKSYIKTKNIKNITIIGGGFIGLEMIEACKKHCDNITLIEKFDRILAPMDKEITDILTDELAKNNINIKLSVDSINVKNVENKNISELCLNSNEKEEIIKTDLVINCVGVRPNTSFIEQVDKIENGAIIVDENMCTNIPNVYAAGDCSVMKSFITNQLMYTPLGTNANKQARIIADVISGKPRKPFKLIGSAAIKLFDVDAAKVGISERDAQRYNIKVKTNVITANNYASYYRSGKVLIKVIYDPETRKILGAQGVGKGTIVPRINYYAVAIYSGLTVDEMGMMDLCYSPPFGGVWDASLIASNTIK